MFCFLLQRYDRRANCTFVTQILGRIGLLTLHLKIAESLKLIETAFCKTGILTILLDTESTLFPVLMDLTELFDCHVCHTR